MTLWQPTASIANLRLRAELLQQIRQFFADRQVWEVDTPLLSQATVTDLHIESFVTHSQLGSKDQVPLYLMTSPEYPMKRLLAAGSGCIYQITKAFRKEEAGREHNPEFTLLEWYRVNFDYHQLIAEVTDLVRLLLNTPAPQMLTYQQVFQQYLNLDPHSASICDLQRATPSATEYHGTEDDKDNWLNLLLSHVIQPQLIRPTFIYDFPASQAALAVIAKNSQNIPVAQRFELYIAGMELANGWQELTDDHEQKQRFQTDLLMRKKLNLAQYPYDQHLIDALSSGLPNCSGVAMGIDRLLMLALKVNSIEKVISFPIDRA